jgi:aminoglycoside phosphotransferase (APT) family kinase protein
MPHEPTLDPAEILSALGISSVSAITPVHGGTDTAIWRVVHGAATSALRVFRPEQAETCRREIAAMQAAREARVPVPAIQASGTWHERPALLLSWCPGMPLWDAIRRRPWRVLSLGMAFGRTQALVHQIPSRAEWQARRTDWIDWAGPIEQPLHAALEQLAARV